jgi:hypothetical protein
LTPESGTVELGRGIAFVAETTFQQREIGELS